MERFSWTYRQFVGGNAALDFANTVIYPDDDTRRFDRIVDAVELGRWVEAGVRLAALPATIERRFGEAQRSDAIRLRDSIDAVFRPLAGGQASSGERLSALLRLSADAAARAPLVRAEHGLALHSGARRRAPFPAHIAISALALAFSPEIGRVKACPACAWLFVDRSRNRRRVWCDMEVCGNRAKSQRYYARRNSARGRA